MGQQTDRDRLGDDIKRELANKLLVLDDLADIADLAVLKGPRGRQMSVSLLVMLAKQSLAGDVWVVGKLTGLADDGSDRAQAVAAPFDVIGVYAHEALALAACRDWTMFVGCAKLNRLVFPTAWPGAYFPVRKWVNYGR